MSEPLGLSTYRWNNNLKSFLLLGAFPLLLAALLGLFFLIVGWMYADANGLVPLTFVRVVAPFLQDPVTPFSFSKEGLAAYWPYAFGVAGVWLVLGTLFNEGLIRLSTRAMPVSRSEQPKLYNLLENLCISRGLPMPKLFMIDTSVRNAYASGLGRSSFSITVTRGLLEALSSDELEAVLAHELSHIINRDVRLLVVTVLFGSMLSFFAEMLWRSLRASSSSSKNGNRKGSAAPLLVAAVLFSIGYVVSLLLRFALSRRREFLADAGAVALTKRPEALISALEKISGHAAMPDVPSGVQAMMIENPPTFFDFLDTHPPIESRIAVLRRLGGLPEPAKSIIPKT